MKTRLVLLVVLILVGLTACKHAVLPSAPASTVPLIEYSEDGGEVWRPLVRGDVVHLSASDVRIRKTREGATFDVIVMDDASSLNFIGSVTKEGDIIVMEGEGTLMIRADGSYAKIVLE